MLLRLSFNNGRLSGDWSFSDFTVSKVRHTRVMYDETGSIFGTRDQFTTKNLNPLVSIMSMKYHFLAHIGVIIRSYKDLSLYT